MGEATVQYMVGIDEAGRGPVLGPMVYGVCACPINLAEERLACMGFADSKTLSAEERDRLFEDIKTSDFLEWKVDAISPQDISSKMLRKNKYNLNRISFDSAIGLIRSCIDEKNLNVTQIFVDTVGDPRKYTQLLEAEFPGAKVTVAKKADLLYPIVSAASICAKVTRDYLLDNWRFDEGSTIIDSKLAQGSGYPGDSVTKAWLRQHLDPVFGFPSLVRFSWSTAKKLLDEHSLPMVWYGLSLLNYDYLALKSTFAQRIDNGDDDEDSAAVSAANRNKITNYWTKSASNDAENYSDQPVKRRKKSDKFASLQDIPLFKAAPHRIGRIINHSMDEVF